MKYYLSQIFSIFKMEGNTLQDRLRWFATCFIILFGIYYIPIDTRGGFGVLKFILMIMAAFVLLFFTFKVTKAMIIGLVYVLYQILAASFYPESFRWSTVLFSVGLVSIYVCLYNLIYIERVLNIKQFLRIVKWMMNAYFVFCIIQQAFIIVGIKIFPLINLTQIFDRGIGCNSLSMEPSTFGRFMLVFYYAYVKCNEYLRGEGPFTVKELFTGEHRWVTIRFLWMMTTMGSGTAFVCLILFSLYFVRKNNFYYLIPILCLGYIILQNSEIEQANRATSVMSAMTTMDQKQVEEADGSGASRISPLFNSFNADFSKAETWFGHGIDYSNKHNMVLLQTATLFDDYGFALYIIAMIFNISCAYNFFSLGIIFMIAGVGGGVGAGSNIHYTWELMIVMTCVKYFYDNRYNLEDDEQDQVITR